MKRLSSLYLFLLFIVAIGNDCASQTTSKKYWVQFKNKDNSPYSISAPSEYLSSNALKRREIQKIPIDERDLPVNPQYLQGLSDHGAKVLNPSKWLNGTTILLEDSTKLIDIAALPYVLHFSQLARQAVSNEPSNGQKKFEEQLTNTIESAPGYGMQYGFGFNQIHMLNGDYLHALGYAGKGVVIAVLDAGFNNADNYPAFDSLIQGGRILGTWDFVDGNTNVYDDFAHGTLVLSTMAANSPRTLIGTAPDASYFLFRTEDATSETLIEEYNWVTGAEYSDQIGADIITSSLGYTTFDLSSTNHTYADLDGNTAPATIGANIAFEKGMLVVNSAGNEGRTGWHYIVVPADGHSVIAVGAVDSLRTYASFSSAGPASDGSIKPNVATQGAGTYVSASSGGAFKGNGTSFACPILSGMAACLWQAYPNATNKEIKDAIEQSADHYSSPDSKTGYGIPDFAKAYYILRDHQRSSFNNDQLFAISENPFFETLGVRFYSKGSQNIIVSLIDILGRSVLSELKYCEADSFNAFDFDTNNIRSSGVMFLSLEAQSGTYLRKLMHLSKP